MADDTNEYNAEGNGDGSYEAFVASLGAKGLIADGEKIAREGAHLLEATSEQRAAAVHYIAAVNKAESIFKNQKLLAGILDQMARTAYPNEDAMIALQDLVDWGLEYDYEPALVYAYETLISWPSVGGVSRKELVDTVTMVQHNQRNYQSANRNRSFFGRGSQPNDIATS